MQRSEKLYGGRDLITIVKYNIFLLFLHYTKSNL